MGKNEKCWASIALARWMTVLVISILLSCNTPHVVGERTVKDAPGDSNSCRGIRKSQCLTPACVHSASAFLKNMDSDVDPCDNFYRYACGGFINKSFIPDDQSQIDNLKILEKKIYKQMKLKIQAKSEANEPRYVKLIKDFYQICINKPAEDPMNEPFRVQLDNLGGWPVLLGEKWKEDEFDWIDAIHKYRNSGHFYTGLIDFRVEPNLKNPTQNVIYIDRPVLEFDKEHPVEGIDDPKIVKYYEHMAGIALLLDADLEYAIKELENVLEFEIKLANISSPAETPQNGTESCNPMTLGVLLETYPRIPWKEYFNGLLPSSITVEENEVIIVCVPSYFTQLEKLLSETPKRVLANYLMWRVMESMAVRLNDAPRSQAVISTSAPKVIDPPRTDECVKDVFKEFPIIVGAMFVKYHFSKETKENVMEVASNIRKQFEDTVMETDWVDEATRKEMLDKVTATVDHIGYPDELLDDNKLNMFYEKLNFSGNSYSECKLKLTKFENDYRLGKLREPVNKTEWTSHGDSAGVTVFYSETENSFQLPAGILQGVFFNNERPNYMNYGAVGFIIGHEMMHSFNDGVKQFDKDGNLINWPPHTEKLWNSSVQCLAKQYEKYEVPELDIKLNGSKTQNENFADNGGIKIAYQAYNSWVAKNGPEKKLPGIDLTPKQMFWLSAANAWCTKYNPTALESEVSDEHSLKEFRILGSFSNMPEFADDFKCSHDSRMNPRKRCLVW